MLEGEEGTSETTTKNQFLRKPTTNGNPKVTIYPGFWDGRNNSILPSQSTSFFAKCFQTSISPHGQNKLIQCARHVTICPPDKNKTGISINAIMFTNAGFFGKDI